jgi:hypothetical protein
MQCETLLLAFFGFCDFARNDAKDAESVLVAIILIVFEFIGCICAIRIHCAIGILIGLPAFLFIIIALFPSFCAKRPLSSFPQCLAIVARRGAEIQNKKLKEF